MEGKKELEKRLKENQARDEAEKKLEQLLSKGLTWFEIGCKLEKAASNQFGQDDGPQDFENPPLKFFVYAELAIDAYKKAANGKCPEVKGYCPVCMDYAKLLEERARYFKAIEKMFSNAKKEEWKEAAEIARREDWKYNAAEYYARAGDIQNARLMQERWGSGHFYGYEPREEALECIIREAEKKSKEQNSQGSREDKMKMEEEK